MNNFDEKIIKIETMLDDCEEKIQNLDSKIVRLEEKEIDLNEDFEKLESLTYQPFHKDGKRINLKIKTGLLFGLIGICSSIMALLSLIGVGNVILIIHSLVTNKLTAIFENNLILILLSSIVSFIGGIISVNKLSVKLQIYSDLRRLNNSLFSDDIYSKEKIENKKEIINKQRQNIVNKQQQISEKINELCQEHDSLEALLNEVESYKASFDDVINQIYDKNISSDLKEKLEKTLVKVKK